jgi:hypothetical protein
MAQFDPNYKPLPESHGSGSSRAVWLLPLALLVAAAVVVGMYAAGRMVEPRSVETPERGLQLFADAVVAKDWGTVYSRMMAGTRAELDKRLDKDVADGRLDKHKGMKGVELFKAAMNDPQADAVTQPLLPFRTKPTVVLMSKTPATTTATVEAADVQGQKLVFMVLEEGQWRLSIRDLELDLPKRPGGNKPQAPRPPGAGQGKSL